MRQRPGAEDLVVALEMIRRRLRRRDGIASLVDRVIDPHVQPSGPRHELPDTRGAHLRIGVHVEARLDQRQPCQLDRQTLALEDRLHLRQVAARHFDAGSEAVTQTGLRADAILGRGSEERGGFLDIAEQRPYFPLLIRQLSEGSGPS